MYEENTYHGDQSKKRKKNQWFYDLLSPPRPYVAEDQCCKEGEGGGGPTVPSNRVSLAMALHWDARPEAKVNLEALLLL